MTAQGFQVGDKVEWRSSNTDKQGTIICIVPKGRVPAEVGYPGAGGGGSWRGQESYIVEAFRNPAKKTGRAVYWPVITLLHLVEDCAVAKGASDAQD